MQSFDLPAGKIVGEIKNEIREAILEGDIANEFNEAKDLMIKLGKQRGLVFQHLDN